MCRSHVARLRPLRLRRLGVCHRRIGSLRVRYRLRRPGDDVHGLSVLRVGQLFRSVHVLLCRRGHPTLFSLWRHPGTAVRLGNRNSVELHGEYRGVHDAGRELPVSRARGPSEEHQGVSARSKCGVEQVAHAPCDGRHPRRHCRRDTQGHVDPGEVVVRETVQAIPSTGAMLPPWRSARPSRWSRGLTWRRGLHEVGRSQGPSRHAPQGTGWARRSGAAQRGWTA